MDGRVSPMLIMDRCDHQQSFVDEQPARREAWELLLHQRSVTVPDALVAWWGWTWRDAVVGLAARKGWIEHHNWALESAVSRKRIDGRPHCCLRSSLTRAF